MSNTELWDKLGKTDPDHTKGFTRAGGFKGTAIKPMFSYFRMTEEFGPCGVGWGVNKPEFQVVDAGDDTLVFCTVSMWHGSKDNTVFGVGGDKVASKNKNGTFTDDEAFKKAFTDAVTNAMKLIGVGADVHMGMFDDQKYVNTMKEKFKVDETPKEDPLIKKAQSKVDEVLATLKGQDTFQIGQWMLENPKEVDALRWVQRNYPDLLKPITDLGVEL